MCSLNFHNVNTTTQAESHSETLPRLQEPQRLLLLPPTHISNCTNHHPDFHCLIWNFIEIESYISVHFVCGLCSVLCLLDSSLTLYSCNLLIVNVCHYKHVYLFPCCLLASVIFQCVFPNEDTYMFQLDRNLEVGLYRQNIDICLQLQQTVQNGFRCSCPPSTCTLVLHPCQCVVLGLFFFVQAFFGVYVVLSPCSSHSYFPED